MAGRTTVFLSGKLISTVAKSLKKSKEQLLRTKQLLVQEGFIKDVKIQSIIRNIFVTFDFNRNIDFRKIIQKKIKVVYEPEQFPGLIYKSNIGLTCLIFSSGKVVIAGSKSEKQIEETIEGLNNTVTQ